MVISHHNSDRLYARGTIHNAAPHDKVYRLNNVREEVVKVANRMRKLVQFFQLTEKQIYDIIYNEFGVGVGYQTTRIFLNESYGPGYNCKEVTLDKYRYLIRYLKKKKKQFAKPMLSSRLSNVRDDKPNKPTKKTKENE